MIYGYMNTALQLSIPANSAPKMSHIRKNHVKVGKKIKVVLNAFFDYRDVVRHEFVLEGQRVKKKFYFWGVYVKQFVLNDWIIIVTDFCFFRNCKICGV